MDKIINSIYMTLFLLVWLSGFAYFVMMISYAQPEQRQYKTDAIVILTGGNFRTTTGLSLFADQMAPELIITGVNKLVTEKDIRNLWKNDKPLPLCCITLDQNATTTFENAIEVKRWMEKKNFKSLRLVTSTYHLQRAMLEFKLAMPNVKIIPHPVEEEDYGYNEVKFWLISFSEYNKYICRYITLLFQRGHI